MNCATLVLRFGAPAEKIRESLKRSCSVLDTMGGLQTFATGARWQRDNGESRQSNCHGSGVGAALRKAAVSPNLLQANEFHTVQLVGKICP
jgi:hypothetical protein